MERRTVTFAEELHRTGRLIYKNKGVSMRPLIRQGKDLMIIEKRGPERIDRWEAVLFQRHHGQYVLHRILEVREDDYWIVGDNCVSGEYVKDEQILGVLTGVVRGKKEVHTTDLGYRLYVTLWCKPYRVRMTVLKVVGVVKSVGKKVLGR